MYQFFIKKCGVGVLLGFGLILGCAGIVKASDVYTLSGPNTGREGEQSCWTITGPISGLDTFWHGTKNTTGTAVTDVYDLLGPATNSGNYCYIFSNGDAGNFVRYAHIKEGNNHQAYTTNTLYVTVFPAATNETMGGGSGGQSGGGGGGGSSGGGGSNTTVQPSISLVANPTSIVVGGSSILNWNVSNATSCAASGGWSGMRALSGNTSVTPNQTTIYSLTCINGSLQSSQSVTVSVNISGGGSGGGNGGNIVQPSINLVANPTSVTAGGSSILSWTTANATSCSASGGWSGNRALSGNETITTNQTTTYSFTCSNGNIQSSQSVTVFTTQNNSSNGGNTSNNNGTYGYPLVSIVAVPQFILPGETTTINWSATNSWFCTASDGWGGSKNLVGNQTFQLWKTTRFEIMCGNPGANISQEITVTVVPTGQLNAVWNIFSSNNNNVYPTGFVASCTANPGSVAAGSNVIFAGGQSGGVGPVRYSWNGDVYGNGQLQNVAFGSTGTKVARLVATDAVGKTAVATCAMDVTSAIPVSNTVVVARSNSAPRTAPSTNTSRPVLAVETEEIVAENTPENETNNRFLLASIIPASIRNMTLTAAYLFLLTFILLGIIIYLFVTRRKIS